MGHNRMHIIMETLRSSASYWHSFLCKGGNKRNPPKGLFEEGGMIEGAGYPRQTELLCPVTSPRRFLCQSSGTQGFSTPLCSAPSFLPSCLFRMKQLPALPDSLLHPILCAYPCVYLHASHGENACWTEGKKPVNRFPHLCCRESMAALLHWDCYDN